MANQAARLIRGAASPLWVVEGRVVSTAARVSRQPERLEVVGSSRGVIEARWPAWSVVLGWSISGGRRTMTFPCGPRGAARGGLCWLVGGPN
jgi:hypothetical protein